MKNKKTSIGLVFNLVVLVGFAGAAGLGLFRSETNFEDGNVGWFEMELAEQGRFGAMGPKGRFDERKCQKLGIFIYNDQTKKLCI